MTTAFTVAPIAVVVIIAAVILIHWRQHGLGKWRGGPRIAAIGLIAVGWAAIGVVAPLGKASSHDLGQFVASLVGNPTATPWITLIGDNGSWLIGVALAYVWFRALFPGVSETMGYGLAWAGILVPGLVLTGPAIFVKTGGMIFGAVATGVSHLVTTIAAHTSA